MSFAQISNVVAHSGPCSTDVAGEEDDPDGSIREKEHHNEEREWKSPDNLTTNTTRPTDKETKTETLFTHTDAKVLCDVLAPSPKSGTEDKEHDPTHGNKVVHFSWVSPKLEARVSAQGSGVFALVDIPKDDHLVVWTGRILSAEQALPIMQTHDKHYILQVGEFFYQVPLCEFREPADWTNHSCEPNAGFGKGSPICLSAMREIKAGEQICFDYAMCETDERLWDPMDFLCGTPSCRGKITANDWKNFPELRQKYKGYWSPHVQRLLDAMDKASATATGAPQTAQTATAKAGISIVRAKPAKKGAKKRLAGRKKSRGPRRWRIGA